MLAETIGTRDSIEAMVTVRVQTSQRATDYAQVMLLVGKGSATFARRADERVRDNAQFGC